ncbi:hypothetical protein AUP68_03918 [Ilyonectria robusta]
MAWCSGRLDAPSALRSPLEPGRCGPEYPHPGPPYRFCGHPLDGLAPNRRLLSRFPASQVCAKTPPRPQARVVCTRYDLRRVVRNHPMSPPPPKSLRPVS